MRPGRCGNPAAMCWRAIFHCGEYSSRRVLGIRVWGLLGSRSGDPGNSDRTHLGSHLRNGKEVEKEQGATRGAVGEEVELGALTQGSEAGKWPQWLEHRQVRSSTVGGGQKTFWGLGIAHFAGLAWGGLFSPPTPSLLCTAPLPNLQWSGVAATGGPWHRVIKTSVSLMKSYPLPGRGRHKSL